MKILPPLRYDPKEEAELERAVKSVLNEAIFESIIQELRNKSHLLQSRESQETLVKAIEIGKILYSNGYFKGKFNANISSQLVKLGAVYNNTSRTFYLNPLSVPSEVIGAAYRIHGNQSILKSSLLSAVSLIPLNTDLILEKTSFEPIFKKMTQTLGKEFSETLNVIPFTTEKTDQAIEQAIDFYSKEMKIYIKKFTNEQTQTLRKMIAENDFAGYRGENLRKIIKDQFGVTERKSKFLARQETSLLTSNYRRFRYEAIGVESYIWSTSHDSRVRHDHRLLNGKVFRWDNPPVVDEKTGRRANAGSDFGCRCVAKAILLD